MAVLRSIVPAAALLALAFGPLRASAAAGATIHVVQIRATRGGGPQQIDRNLQYLKRKLSALPYSKYELVGRFTGAAQYGQLATIRLAEGLTLRATPAQQGDRIGLDANLFKGTGLLLRTRLVVRPNEVGFLICPVANRATILAITVR